MYSRVKEFQDFPGGQQYLFTQDDFYLLESWIVWMAINHRHQLFITTPTQSEAQAVPDTSVVIHQDSVHGSSNRPVGYVNAQIAAYLTIHDHVTNAEIHKAPEEDASATAGSGQLAYRGWTEPIKVMVVVSHPLFEVYGVDESGPLFMPFPHHNMAPAVTYQQDYLNQMDPSASYLDSSPAVNPYDHDLYIPGSKPKFLPGGGSMPGITGYPNLPMKGTYWAAHGADRDGSDAPFYYAASNSAYARFPFPSNAKYRGNPQFLNNYQQFLYVLPPYLYSPVKLKPSFDKVFEAANTQNLTYFFHRPLFVDSRRTKLLDSIRRSGVTQEEVVNFRDLISHVSQDSDKPDFFNVVADKTCWLSKYDPLAVKDDKVNSGRGALLFFNDFSQEINQFLSQVNYPGQVMETADQVYWDFPFRVVTVDFDVNASMGEDLSDPEVSGRAKRGFPACTYDTDFVNHLVEAGGHNRDTRRPQEDFYFRVFMDGVTRFKEWYKSEFASDIPELAYENHNKYYDYFDKLNVPLGFTNGERQVLVLKDPNIFRRETVIKRNPYNNMRAVGYTILEGYITVPFEAFYTSFATSDLELSGMDVEEPLSGDPDAGGSWKLAPDSTDVEQKLLDPTPGLQVGGGGIFFDPDPDYDGGGDDDGGDEGGSGDDDDDSNYDDPDPPSDGGTGDDDGGDDDDDSDDDFDETGDSDIVVPGDGIPIRPGGTGTNITGGTVPSNNTTLLPGTTLGAGQVDVTTGGKPVIKPGLGACDQNWAALGTPAFNCWMAISCCAEALGGAAVIVSAPGVWPPVIAAIAPSGQTQEDFWGAISDCMAANGASLDGCAHTVGDPVGAGTTG